MITMQHILIGTRKMIKLFVLPLLLVSSLAFGACDNLYPYNKRIVVKNTLELCNRQYVAVYDAHLHRNIFSSEFISKNKTRVDRVDNFKIDQRAIYVKPSYYKNSGYDKGHQAPAANANDALAMDESFLMTNMTPQAPKLNRGPWNKLESYIRKTWTGEYHIITGAVYDKKSVMIGPKKDIPVPKGYYKCVIDVQVTCFVADNVDTSLVYPASPQEVNRISGIKFFK